MSTERDDVPGERSLERRQILKAAGAFAAALTALGISPDDWSAVQRAEAQPQARKGPARAARANPRIAAQALKRALEVRDVQRAIRETPGLTDVQKAALGRLTAAEITQLVDIRNKLKDTLEDVATDTGYVFW